METFNGPDELADKVLSVRQKNPEESARFGNLSDNGVRGLIRLAYNASLSPNETRYPRLILLVSAEDSAVEPLMPLQARLDSSSLRRLAPSVHARNHALAVEESENQLAVTGLVPLKPLLSDLTWGDPSVRSVGWPAGLSVGIEGPGHLRAGEFLLHRLRAGVVTQETSVRWEPWLREWCNEASEALLTDDTDGVRDFFGRILGSIWFGLLDRAAQLGHGGCFVLLPNDPPSVLRPAFATTCELGVIVSDLFQATPRRPYRSSAQIAARYEYEQEHGKRHYLRERLLSTMDAIAQLSATDGCVVFDRRLTLRSFGTMIEPGIDSSVQCLLGDTDERVDESRLRSFGARRQSALRLCRACPNAKAFVVSQDGELRIFVNRDGVVRLYDDVAYW